MRFFRLAYTFESRLRFKDIGLKILDLKKPGISMRFFRLAYTFESRLRFKGRTKSKKPPEPSMQDKEPSTSESDADFSPKSGSESESSWSADSESMMTKVVALRKKEKEKEQAKEKEIKQKAKAKKKEKEKGLEKQKLKGKLADKDDESEASLNSNGRIVGKKSKKSYLGTKTLDPSVYVDNSKSVGGQVKEAGKVIATFYEHKKTMSNVNCAMETLGRVFASFDPKKRRIVTKMGFGKLLYCAGKTLPRHLSYWIATRIDVKNQTLVTVDGKEIRLNPVQVRWVLGLPMGKKPLPRKCVDKALEDYLYDKYGTTMGQGTSGIYRSTLLKAVEAPLVDDDVEEFKQVFVVLLLNILCATSCHRVSKKHMHPVAVATLKPKKYDWCSIVLDELVHALRCFSKRFYAEGWAPCLGGCTYFLVILYLDRLQRVPVQWDVFPRIKVWTTDELKKAEKEDRLTCRDYGKLGCFTADEVSYGILNHPKREMDTLPTRRHLKRRRNDEVSESSSDSEDIEVELDKLCANVKRRRTHKRGKLKKKKEAAIKVDHDAADYEDDVVPDDDDDDAPRSEVVPPVQVQPVVKPVQVQLEVGSLVEPEVQPRVIPEVHDPLLHDRNLDDTHVHTDSDHEQFHDASDGDMSEFGRGDEQEPGNHGKEATLECLPDKGNPVHVHGDPQQVNSLITLH